MATFLLHTNSSSCPWVPLYILVMIFHLVLSQIESIVSVYGPISFGSLVWSMSFSPGEVVSTPWQIRYARRSIFLTTDHAKVDPIPIPDVVSLMAFSDPVLVMHQWWSYILLRPWFLSRGWYEAMCPNPSPLDSNICFLMGISWIAL